MIDIEMAKNLIILHHEKLLEYRRRDHQGNRIIVDRGEELSCKTVPPIMVCESNIDLVHSALQSTLSRCLKILLLVNIPKVSEALYGSLRVMGTSGPARQDMLNVQRPCISCLDCRHAILLKNCTKSHRSNNFGGSDFCQ